MQRIQELFSSEYLFPDLGHLVCAGRDEPLSSPGPGEAGHWPSVAHQPLALGDQAPGVPPAPRGQEAAADDLDTVVGPGHCALPAQAWAEAD